MKVIVFDLGGTLMEYIGMPHSWVDYYRQGFDAIDRKFSFGVSETDILKSIEVLKEYNPRVHYREEEYTPEYIFSKALEHWGKNIEITDCIHTFFDGLCLNASIYPDTVPMLLKLKSKGYNIAALTDLPSAMPDDLFKKDITDLLQFLDLYVSSQSCGFRKPNCKGLQKIASYFHVPITDLIFVGDEEKDRKTAINAGCRFICINRKEKNCGSIYNLYELEELL